MRFKGIMMAVGGEGWEETAQPELSIVFTSRLRVRLFSGSGLRTGLGLRSSAWKPGHLQCLQSEGSVKKNYLSFYSVCLFFAFKNFLNWCIIALLASQLAQ